jgi:hypothetical protein
MKHSLAATARVDAPGDPWLARRVEGLLGRLPSAAGAPLLLERVAELRDRHGAAHAGSFLRERRIAIACTNAEFPRVFVHEWFHFVWLRAGNPLRRDFEALLAAERRAGARGELGWSAEWRRRALTEQEVSGRSRRWREYCCESFCDTAAWLYAGVAEHPEFTLAVRFRRRRQAWFAQKVSGKQLSI